MLLNMTLLRNSQTLESTWNNSKCGEGSWNSTRGKTGAHPRARASRAPKAGVGAYLIEQRVGRPSVQAVINEDIPSATANELTILFNSPIHSEGETPSDRESMNVNAAQLRI